MRTTTKANRAMTYLIALSVAVGVTIAAWSAPETANAAQIVRVIAPTVAYENPGFGAPVKTVPTITPYGHDQMQLRVLSSVPGEVDPATGVQRTYYKVHLPYRRSRLDSSNGHVGWVASDTVQLTSTPWSVVVHRGSRTLTLKRFGRVYRTWRVVVGQSSMQTPSGSFSVYGKTTRDHSFDGTGLMPFAYSPVLAQFDGGPGMIAMHGRSGASLSQPLGGAYSHGCVRMDNSKMQLLLDRLPIGTPVDVV